MAYTEHDTGHGTSGTERVSDVRTRPQGSRKPTGAGEPGQRGRGFGQPEIRPAHPLPQYRSGTLDYDRYLERSTDKFKIFSAAERRRRNRAIAIGVAIVALVVVIVAWAIMSQPA